MGHLCDMCDECVLQVMFAVSTMEGDVFLFILFKNDD